MQLEYINSKGEKVGTTEVKFMPRTGEKVDLGSIGTFKITNIVRHNPQQLASVYLEEDSN